jgi:Fe-S cluster biosynthesis and repair protein YggX
LAEVACRRCAQRKSALAQAPVPGKWGDAIVANTCPDCWHEWVEEQTRLINHERLVPSEPANRKILYARMAEFLNLEA